MDRVVRTPKMSRHVCKHRLVYRFSLMSGEAWCPHCKTVIDLGTGDERKKGSGVA